MLGSSFGSYQATTMGTNSNSENHMAQGSAAGGEDTTGGKAHSKHTSRRSTETSSAVSRKPPFSLRMWKLAAKQQNVDANIRAGDMYFYGLQGIPVDFEQAAAHYRIATALGSPQAMFNLGWHYQYGVGLPVDFHLAKRYYDQAHETNPREAHVPSKLAFLSLWLYSSCVIFVLDCHVQGNA